MKALYGSGLEPADHPVRITNPADLLKEHEALEAAFAEVTVERDQALADAEAQRRQAARFERDYINALAEVARISAELDGVRESLAERQSRVEDLEATVAMRDVQLRDAAAAYDALIAHSCEDPA